MARNLFKQPNPRGSRPSDLIGLFKLNIHARTNDVQRLGLLPFSLRSHRQSIAQKGCTKITHLMASGIGDGTLSPN